MKQFFLIFVLISINISHSQAEVSIHGFGSLYGVYNDSDGPTKSHAEFKDEGEFSFKPYSKFGLQFSTPINEKWLATLQLYTEGVNNFEVEARWAYLTYKVADNHIFKIGRVAHPIFHQSEYEKIGYAHNYPKLPKAVYLDFAFSTVEGVSLDSNYYLGDYKLSSKLLYGNWDGELHIISMGGYVPFGLKNIFSVNLTLSKNWWKIFGGSFVAEIEADSIDSEVIKPLSQRGIDMALSNGATQNDIDQYYKNTTWDGKDALYLFAGFGIDYNDYLFETEITRYGVYDSVDNLNTAYLIGVGKRINELTIVIHYENLDQDHTNKNTHKIDNPILKETHKTLSKALTIRTWDGIGLNVRWDFDNGLALKCGYFVGDDIRVDVGKFSLISMGVDFVF